MDDINQFFLVSGVVPSLSDYKFTSVIQLRLDYRRGIFDAGLKRMEGG